MFPSSRFLIVFLTFVVPTPQVLPPSGNLTIHGRIIDSTGSALPGIEVIVTSDLVKLPRITVTNEEGKYSLSRLSEGQYLIRTEMAGFESKKQEIGIRATTSLTMDITVDVKSGPNCPGVGCLISVPDLVPAGSVPSDPKERLAIAEHLVGRMWGLSAAEARAQIPGKLRPLDADSLPALLLALEDPDAQMRQNGAIVLLNLIGDHSRGTQFKLAVGKILPALIKALEDPDGNVRTWSAESIGEIGPEAGTAVPALVLLLKYDDLASRKSSCTALGKMGSAARAALPYLNEALRDNSDDVQQCARQSIETIQH
jgi:Carboxypeptidase regulatory-like domain/HEAT repeats